MMKILAFSLRKKSEMTRSLRGEVLRLYRSILRTSLKWEAKEQSKTLEESVYIKEEAKKLFRKNKDVNDERLIREYLQEGEARLEMALHYRTPYPRPVNLPPMALASNEGKGNRRRQEKSRPVYIKSIDTSS